MIHKRGPPDFRRKTSTKVFKRSQRKRQVRQLLLANDFSIRTDHDIQNRHAFSLVREGRLTYVSLSCDSVIVTTVCSHPWNTILGRYAL